MSARQPPEPRGGPLGAVLTLLAVVAVVVLVAWLRATAPQSPTDTAVPAEALGGADVLDCEELEREGPVAATDSTRRAPSGAVLESPFAFDGLRVRYVGEVVGDVLQRDGGSWVLLNDDDYALRTGPLGAGGEAAGTNSGLSVWLPDPLDELATVPGRAGVRGDVLDVVATVQRADPADGGGLTLRVDDATLLAPAVELEDPVHWRQVGAAIALGVLALGLTLRDRTRRRR